MKTGIIILILGLFQICHAREEAWLTQRIGDIERASSLPPDERIAILGQLTVIGADRMDDEQRQVFELAQAALLETPGHAEYFAKRINDARAKVDSLPPEDRASAWVALQNEQSRGFKVLQMLPSSEAIKVLGEFLYDERGQYANDEDAERHGVSETGERSNASKSLETLTAMPLASKPVQIRKYKNVVYNEDINAWRLWYEQIKAGNRTFSFEGDSRKFNLLGAVGNTSVPEGRRSQDHAAHNESLPRRTSSIFQIASITIAGLVCIVGFWLIWKRRNL